jgi:filamentous hemagglutinin family protein
MRTTNSTRTRRLAGAIVAAGIGTGVLAGCGGTAGPETGASVDEIQQEAEPGADVGVGEDAGVGVDDAAADDVNSYIGQRVTVSAEVNDVLSPSAFTIAGTAGSGGAEELLVIANDPGVVVDEESAAAVTGTVRQAFDLAAAESEFGYDYDDAAFTEYEGEPYIVAESIDPTITPPADTTIDPAA